MNSKYFVYIQWGMVRDVRFCMIGLSTGLLDIILKLSIRTLKMNFLICEQLSYCYVV